MFGGTLEKYLFTYRMCAHKLQIGLIFGLNKYIHFGSCVLLVWLLIQVISVVLFNISTVVKSCFREV